MNWTEIEAQLKAGLRAKRGSQTEVAKRLNIKQPSVAGYASGGERIPVDHLDTILDVLGLELELKERQ